MLKKKLYKNFFLLFLSVFLLGNALKSHAQKYPVQITSQLIPPFSGYLSDYCAPGNQQLKLLVVFNDFTVPSYTVKIKISISGQGINITSKDYFFAGPFTLQPGVPMEISGSDFTQLLNTRNLNFSGISSAEYEKRKLLPEGYYNICFTAYDYSNPTAIQVSNQSCAFGWMVLNDPPFLNTPICESIIKPSDPQTVFFQWTPMNLVSPNSANSTIYDFELYEVKPENQNPGNIVQTLPPIYRFTTPLTFVNYGITEPQLYPGTKYVWRVQARDEGNRDLFKNKGYSQICTFKYGNSLSQLDSNTLKLSLKGNALNHRLIKYTWDSLSIFSGYRLEYRKKGGVNWFPINTTTSQALASKLEPENTYEAHVKGVSPDGEGPWSDIVVITTPSKPIIVCGQQLFPTSSANSKPHQFGKAGQVWNVGQFEMVVTDLEFANNPSGLYSGYG
ncbi:MAG TPA: fibronectin type III domain-containing protein, partial [Chitinophagales bacterium]|nr:fibronectin type III domain-containing protein [Chitinophagales bacterium]